MQFGWLICHCQWTITIRFVNFDMTVFASCCLNLAQCLMRNFLHFQGVTIDVGVERKQHFLKDLILILYLTLKDMVCVKFHWNGFGCVHQFTVFPLYLYLLLLWLGLKVIIFIKLAVIIIMTDVAAGEGCVILQVNVTSSYAMLLGGTCIPRNIPLATCINCSWYTDQSLREPVHVYMYQEYTSDDWENPL